MVRLVNESRLAEAMFGNEVAHAARLSLRAGTCLPDFRAWHGTAQLSVSALSTRSLFFRRFPFESLLRR